LVSVKDTTFARPDLQSGHYLKFVGICYQANLILILKLDGLQI